MDKAARRFWFIFSLFYTIGIVSSMAGVQPQQIVHGTPLEIVKALYKPYVVDSDSTNEPRSLELINPHATPHLKWLIERNWSCEIKNHEICYIDFDPIVDGQDSDFRGKYPDFREVDFQFHKVVMADYTYPATEFQAADPIHVEFDFIFIDHAWLIANIRGHDQELSYDLLKVLSQK